MSLPIEDLSHVLLTLQQELGSVKSAVSDQRIEISNLYRRLDRKDKEIQDLKRDNKNLSDRLSNYETPPKNSHNSHIPPSQDSISSRKIKRTASLREKSDKKSGGQQGHPGSTLSFSSTPDGIESHVPDYCQHCGSCLSGIIPELLETRQVVDLPEIKPVVSEHRIYGKQCSCGCINQGEFPAQARSRVCYGFNLRAMVSYLSCVQCLPYKRLCEVLKDCFHIEMSQGTVSNILDSMQFTSQDIYHQIQTRVSRSPVVGADETGINVNGKLHWTWAFQTDKLTYLYQDKSRGKLAIDKHFTNGLAQSILVTDRHASYFNLPVKGHQICLAHLLRELTYLSELDKNQDWSTRLMELFKEAIHKRKTMTWETIPRKSLLDRLDELLNRSINKLHQDFHRLQRSLLKHRDNIFRFLFGQDIPYDNNASERAMRIVKVKQKVSGGFRSDQGADNYTQLLSIADTAKKNGMPRYYALLEIAKL